MTLCLKDAGGFHNIIHGNEFLLKKCNNERYYILIIIVITPSIYVFAPIGDVIDVIGHVKYWGKSFVVIQVNSTH